MLILLILVLFGTKKRHVWCYFTMLKKFSLIIRKSPIRIEKNYNKTSYNRNGYIRLNFSPIRIFGIIGPSGLCTCPNRTILVSCVLPLLLLLFMLHVIYLIFYLCNKNTNILIYIYILLLSINILL